jgi:hypothetical protein
LAPVEVCEIENRHIRLVLFETKGKYTWTNILEKMYFHFFLRKEIYILLCLPLQSFLPRGEGGSGDLMGEVPRRKLCSFLPMQRRHYIR